MQDDVNLGLMWTNADSVKRVKRVEAYGGLVTNAWSVCELLEARGGAWSACLTIRSFRQCVWARVRFFLAVLDWVLLGIGCSVMLCFCFGSWMNRTMTSKSCKDYGDDGSNSLLTMVTR